MRAVLFSYASVAAVSLVSLIGLTTLSLGEKRVRALALLFVSFAAGTLLGDAFIHLVPETFSGQPELSSVTGSLLILSGIALFFIVEKLQIHRHLHLHHHGKATPEEEDRLELAVMNLIGDAIHNFIDGLLIGVSYLVSPGLGLSTTIAVLFHEIPQEIADFGILVHSGLSARRATLLNLGSALIAILGATTALAAGAIAHRTVVSLLVPITAGGFVYIATADLIPEMQHDRSLRAGVVQFLLMTLGVAVMAALKLAE